MPQDSSVAIRRRRTANGVIRAAITFVAVVTLCVVGFGVSRLNPSGRSTGSNAVLRSLALTKLPSSSTSPQYGVLFADPQYLTSDYAAGVRLAMVDLAWPQWEPSSGTFSASYVAQEAGIVSTYRKDGFTVAINLGLSQAPQWLLNAPSGQLEDQSGNLSGTANFEFSQQVRLYAAAYISNVVAALGSVSYYTVGMSSTSEAGYPDYGANQWWAFDQAAQGSAGGLPTGFTATPMPGWVPGTKTWRGSTVTTTQVRSWYNWYQKAMVDSLSWEMTTIRNAGFNGWFQLELVGDGANPWVYTNRIASDLAQESYDSYETMNAGAYYPALVSDVASIKGVVIDITSVGDESGTSPDNPCEKGDSSVNYLTNSIVDQWSSTRWLTYLATLHGLPVIGESTGENSVSVMQHDFALAKACGVVGLQWAFDYQLHGGQYATIQNYAVNIKAAG